MDKILDLLSHPLTQAGVAMATRYRAAVRAQAQADALRQQALEALKNMHTGASAPQARPVLADPVGEEIARASALLDEAHRFAVRGQQAEVIPRVQKAAEHLMKAERFWLTPGQIRQLPPDKQEVARRLAPQIAAVRQMLVNSPKLDVEASAAHLDSILKSWATGSGGNPVPILMPQAPAPEMDAATGCVPCARSHLAQVAAELEEAVRAPEDRRAAWVTDAAKQLLALEEFDWSPEKVAASAPEVQQLIRRYQPEVESLRRALMAGAPNLPQLAARARDLQRRFSADADQVRTVLDRAFEQARLAAHTARTGGQQA